MVFTNELHSNTNRSSIPHSSSSLVDEYSNPEDSTDCHFKEESKTDISFSYMPSA